MIDIDRLHRRPPGRRLLVYLDQSVLSRLAEGKFPDLRRLLNKGRQSGDLLCPESFEHGYETVLADKRYFKSIADLTDELSNGVRFLDRDQVWRNEVRTAAASFLGEEPPMEVWREAFDEDPHAPLARLFPVGGLRVSVEAEKLDWLEEEAQEPKSYAEALTELFERARAEGVTFDAHAETEFQGALRSNLGPLVDGRWFESWLNASVAEAEAERARGAWCRHRTDGISLQPNASSPPAP